MCLARAKAVNVLAVRQVKQGTETARFRTGSTLHSSQYVGYASLLIYINTIDDPLDERQ